MSRLLWAFGWAGVTVWSLVCAAAYGILDVVGRLSMRNADVFSSDPETVEWIWRMFSWLHGLSTGTVLVVWALVSLLILAVPWCIDRMIGGAPVVAGRGRPPVSRGDPGAAYPGQGDVIDLSPDQYSVGPRRQDGPGTHVPRISPRG